MRRQPFLTYFGADPALDHLHPYETSWLLPPVVLGIIRGIIAIYIFFCIIYILIYYAVAEQSSYLIGQSFSYFTNLNFWGMGFYFFTSSVHTLLYAATGRSVIFDRLPRVFRGLHALFYTCNTTFPFLVLIIYWGVLYPGTWFPNWFGAWSNLSQHGIIGAYALFEVVLTTTPPHPLLNLAFLIIILALYLSLAYLTDRTQGFYVYPFLDPGDHHQYSGKVAAYCFIILAAVIVIFFVTWVIIWARRRWTHDTIKRAGRDFRNGPQVYDANGPAMAETDVEMRPENVKGPNEF